jgi:hypothetical protein
MDQNGLIFHIHPIKYISYLNNMIKSIYIKIKGIISVVFTFEFLIS